MIAACTKLRDEIRAIESDVRELKKRSMDAPNGEWAGEMAANLMLTVRHLEDARMRLGKVIQAKNGGVSCYDVKPARVIDSPVDAPPKA